MAPASPKDWGLHTTDLMVSWSLFRDSNAATWCQLLSMTLLSLGFYNRSYVFIRGLSWPSKPLTSCKLLHITKFNRKYKAQPWPPLDHSFCVLTLRKDFPEDFCLSDAALFRIPANFSALANWHQQP